MVLRGDFFPRYLRGREVKVLDILKDGVLQIGFKLESDTIYSTFVGPEGAHRLENND